MVLLLVVYLYGGVTKMLKIGVVGCGNVGFAHLIWMNKLGFDVIGYDTNETIRNNISITLGEKSAANSLDELMECDSIHICVPTEPGINGSADMSIFDDVISKLAILLKNKRNVSIVQRSTCPPGSAEYYETKFNTNISYGVNPSFLRKSSIIYDTENPERVAIGGNGLVVEHLNEIYSTVVAPRYITTNKTNVELLKYVENTLDSILISYWNEILQYALKIGLKSTDVIQLIEQIGDREKFKTVSRIPGKAFGLWCLPKDINALIVEMHKYEIIPFLLEGALKTNLLYEKERGVNLVPAQQLFTLSNGKVEILEQGVIQIEDYLKS